MTQKDFHQNAATHRSIFAHLGIGEKNIITLDPEASVDEAVGLMKAHQIGDVVIVTEQNGKSVPVGIVTDRDLALRAIATEANVRVSEVMTPSPLTATIEAGPFEMVRLMKENGITRLLLVDENGSLVGVVNAKRLIQLFVDGLNDLAHISETQKAKEAQGARH